MELKLISEIYTNLYTSPVFLAPSSPWIHTENIWQDLNYLYRFFLFFISCFFHRELLEDN